MSENPFAIYDYDNNCYYDWVPQELRRPPRHTKVYCRKSPLAMAQVNEVYDMLPHLGCSVDDIDTYGDRHREISLWDSTVPSDFFTRDLDDRCVFFNDPERIAIHSAKDMPFPVVEGLEIYALTPCRSQTDSLVTRQGETLATLPAGSRVATSSPNRRRQLLERRPDLEAVSIRGNIEERIRKVMEGEVDALIVATCALERLDMMSYQSEELDFQTHPLQGQLAVVGIKDGPLKEEFTLIDERRKYGRLTIVGAGPGNIGSLTLDGADALEQAHVVFYDDLIGQDLIQRFRKPEQGWIYVGKRSGSHAMEQAEINERLLKGVRSGFNVVRLKGGDPMVFAHIREEIDYVQQGTLLEVRIIPGVTAGVAAAALSQTPLTQRGAATSVAFALGHGKEIQTPNTDTIVYYMCGDNIARIARQLIKAGRPSDTAIRLCCDVTGPKQQFLSATLDEVQYAAIKNTVPTVMIVGKTAECEDYLRLSQKTLHTGTAYYDALDYDREYEDPYNVYEPLITRFPTEAVCGLVPGHPYSPEQFDWVIFTSSFPVRVYRSALEAQGRKLEKVFKGVKVGSVGPTTSAAIKVLGLDVTMQSGTNSADGILRYFAAEVHTPQRILLPHSDVAFTTLSDGLKAMGHEVVDAVIYETKPSPTAKIVDLAPFKRITFSSPSGVDAFIHFYGSLPEGKLLLAIGDTTLNKLIQELGNEKIQDIPSHSGNS
jgi:uroporphyrinogen III methyltransferase/synthase